MSNTKLQPVRRQCLLRTAGSTYLTDGLRSKESQKLEQYLICEPWPIDPHSIGLSAINLVILEDPYIPGIYHIYDWIGAVHYSVAQFIEEAEMHGVSRKIDSILGPQINLLTSESKYFMVHPHAIIQNHDPLYDNRIDSLRTCPTGIEHHDNNEKLSSCLALHWQIEGIAPHELEKNEDRVYQVEMPTTRPKGEDFDYTFSAAYQPKGYTPSFEPGIFMWLPAEFLLFEVIEDQIDHTEEDTLRLLQELGSNIPYTVMES